MILYWTICVKLAFFLAILTVNAEPKFTELSQAEIEETPLSEVAVTVAVPVLPRLSVAVTVYVNVPAVVGLCVLLAPDPDTVPPLHA